MTVAVVVQITRTLERRTACLQLSRGHDANLCPYSRVDLGTYQHVGRNCRYREKTEIRPRPPHSPCRDGERHEKILSNQAGSEFHDVSTYPASSAPCPLTSSQNVSALIRIDKGPAHHGSRSDQPQRSLSQPPGTQFMSPQP